MRISIEQAYEKVVRHLKEHRMKLTSQTFRL